ncbi:MAG: hypothetical protein JXR96_30230 [Deltaproteobacteria bacterium]|nr:hypothetical protein [Deltaproteobacteria bacterium]
MRRAVLGLAMGTLLAACGGGSEQADLLSFTALTFNTGTSENMGHDEGPDDGYSSAHAAISDQYYGDGLAWMPAVEATGAFLAKLQPDLVAFQEIFYAGDCALIPAEARTDFFCQQWTEGQPTVAQAVLGAGYQVMCMPGNADKCAAVKRSFGSFRGCGSDFCLEGLQGSRIEGCGHGARVGRAEVDLASGGTLTLVAVHGSSGFDTDDQLCRVAQFEQVFVDLGDGRPAACGERNLVMGDLNTDPGRMAGSDPSATRFADFAGQGKAFAFLTDVGPDAAPSYMDLLNIDHVVSDFATGSCWIAGLSEGHPAVIDAKYFDHKAVVCSADPSR